LTIYLLSRADDWINYPALLHRREDAISKFLHVRWRNIRPLLLAAVIEVEPLFATVEKKRGQVSG
jgi:hypothetical protein